MGTRKTKSERKDGLVVARCEPELEEKVRAEAEDRRIKPSQVVRDALYEYFEKRSKLKGE